MPRKPKRPCSYPGCPKLTDGQYCEEHQKLVTAQYNKYGRDNFSKSFYKSPEWLLIKKRQLERQPFCEECLKKGERVKATIVDHIVPIKQGGDKYNSSNLQSKRVICMGASVAWKDTFFLQSIGMLEVSFSGWEGSFCSP